MRCLDLQSNPIPAQHCFHYLSIRLLATTLGIRQTKDNTSEAQGGEVIGLSL